MTNQTWTLRMSLSGLPGGSAVRLTALPHFLSALGRIARKQKERVVRWHRHRQTLKVLSKLEARMLRDIGLSGGSGSIHAAATERSRHAAANENRDTEAV